MASSTAAFTVPDMSCMHCVKAIKTALGKVPGVTGVEVDLGSKHVTVAYDSAAVAVDDLKRTLASAGYPVRG